MKKSVVLLALCTLFFSCIGIKIEKEIEEEEPKTLCEKAYYIYFRPEENDGDEYANVSNYSLEEEYGYPEEEEDDEKKKRHEYYSVCTEGKFPIENGYPLWTVKTDSDGHMGSIGIGKAHIKGGYAMQTKIAGIKAQAKLIKRIKILVKDYCDTGNGKGTNPKAIETYDLEIDCNLSHPSQPVIKDIILKDKWKDPKTGDGYVWFVVKKTEKLNQ